MEKLSFIILLTYFYAVSGCSPMYLGEENLESCPDHHGYDYFKGSELSFIILWTCFGIIPFGMYMYTYIFSTGRIIVLKIVFEFIPVYNVLLSIFSVCILSAFAAAKCRKWKHAHEVRKVQTKTITADYRSSFTGTMRFIRNFINSV